MRNGQWLKDPLRSHKPPAWKACWTCAGAAMSNAWGFKLWAAQKLCNTLAARSKNHRKTEAA